MNLNGHSCPKKQRRDMEPKVTAVLGAQWGDEGKGKVVDMLACDADVVCRCQVSRIFAKFRLPACYYFSYNTVVRQYGSSLMLK